MKALLLKFGTLQEVCVPRNSERHEVKLIQSDQIEAKCGCKKKFVV